MRNSTNFRRLHDSFLCRSSNYLKGVLPNILPQSDPNVYLRSDPPPPVLAQSVTPATSSRPDILDVLAAYPGLRLSSALSCISLAGRHILSKLAPPSYMQALMSDPMGGVHALT
jgi:hypothetical protein